MPMIHDNRYKCCIDYMIAKATKGAEQQLLRERYAYCKRRNTNGRK